MKSWLKLSACVLTIHLAFTVLALTELATAAEDVCSRADTIFCEDWDWATGIPFTDTTPDSPSWVGDRRADYSDPNVLAAMPSGILCGGIGHNSDCAFQFTLKQGTKDTFYPEGNFTPHFGATYFRYYIKWSSNFVFQEVDNKMAYLRSYDPNVDRTAFYIKNRIMGVDSGGFSDPVFDPIWGWNYLTQFGSNFGPNGGSSAIIPKGGQWYCVESMIQPSSADGVADGAVRFWVDGVLYTKEDAVHLWPNTAGINQIFLSSYYGGAGSSPPEDLQSWRDNLVVSKSRIGCIDNPPPAPPTGLTVR